MEENRDAEIDVFEKSSEEDESVENREEVLENLVGNEENCDPTNHDERWLRTRSKVNYQESSESDASDTETLDDTMSSEDEEQDIEIMREESEEVSDSVADIAYGLEDRSPDDSNQVFEVTGCESDEICFKCDLCNTSHHIPAIASCG